MDMWPVNTKLKCMLYLEKMSVQTITEIVKKIPDIFVVYHV